MYSLLAGSLNDSHCPQAYSFEPICCIFKSNLIGYKKSFTTRCSISTIYGSDEGFCKFVQRKYAAPKIPLLSVIYFHSFHTLYRIPSSVLPSRVPSGHRQGQRICRHNRLQSAVRRWKMPKTNNQYPFIKKAIYSGSVSRQSFLPTL